MDNKKCIEQITTLIEGNYNKQKENMGYVDRNFFESAELKVQIQSLMTSLEMAGFPKLNEDKFAYLYKLAVQQFMHEHNPHAMEEMAERLLEATQRGLWQEPGDYADKLQDLLLSIDAQQEGMQ